MDSIGDLIGPVVFVVVAIARKICEQREIMDRQQEMRRRKPERCGSARKRLVFWTVNNWCNVCYKISFFRSTEA